MTSSELKLQQKILQLLRKQYFDFYEHHTKNYLMLDIKEISEHIKVNHDITLKLLTNLDTRKLIGIQTVSHWSYAILEEGIAACDEELLLRESKVKFWTTLSDRIKLISIIISLIIAAIALFFNIIEINTLKKNVHKQETRIKSLEDSNKFNNSH